MNGSFRLGSVLLLLALGLMSPGQTATATEIKITRETWHDAKRDRDVPVTIYAPEGAGPFPIVIFSHGLGGSRDGYEYLGRHWAEHGYICVHLQHLGSDDAVWRNAPLLGRTKTLAKAAANPQNAVNRTADVSFALDELERLNQSASPWQQRLALDQIGVAGHSFGAYTALAVAGQVFRPGVAAARPSPDPRIKAIIPLSAPVPANHQRLDAAYAAVTIPALHMTGTRDDSPIGDTKAAERRLPFEHCRHSDQFLITFQDGDHMLFSGRGSRTTRRDKQDREWILKSSTAFWDAYLRHDEKAKAWLVNDFKGELGKDGTLEVKLLGRN